MKFHENSEQAICFDNIIVQQLYEIYSVEQSATAPYNPYCYSPCKWLNGILQNPLKIQPKYQKHN